MTKMLDLTPDLCRAGRALLAWTQRELAKRAQVAVSTVADFERGSRAPITNSIDAITAALEAGGVRFESGRAVLSSSTAGFATLAEGRPIRWVDSADLGDWANRRDGQSGLPQLISMLIRASVGADVKLHFPAGESVQRGGWDGVSDSPLSTDYVPAGLSGWELTVQRQRIEDKADDDFDKRADSGDADSRTSTTFIFVVMRSWPKKDAWAARQRKRGIFSDVRALDVDDLVHWLDAYPVVQQWLAEKIGKRPRSGVASLHEMWQRWSLCAKPPLTERLMLAGRDQESTDIHAWLKGPPSVLTVCAESVDEAVAFLWAAVSALPDVFRDAYLTHTLYADSDEAVRELAAAMKSLIVVMNGENAGFAQSVALKGHHAYAVLGPDAPKQSGISLGRVRRADLADSLEAMGKERRDARSLAVRSGGSVAALRRIMADEAMPAPRWLASASSRSVQAALLCGAWDEKSPADKAVITALAGQTHDEVARELAPLVNGIDALLRRSGTKMRLASGQDAWLLLAPRLTEADVQQYFVIAREVLREIDPRFEHRDRSPLITLEDKQPTHSRELRRGIVETLNMMATLPDRAMGVQLLEERVRGFVRELFDKVDAGSWWSLRDNLPGLAEAAPQEFLDAVETSLASWGSPITVLLLGDGEGVLSREYISDLTSALERLAWSADYFAAAVMCLAGLAAKDAGGSRHGNRPAASLRQIFLPWTPQTYVALDDRLKVLDRIRDQYPEVAWPLMLTLLPKNFDTSSFSSEPIWRRADDGERERVTPDLLKTSADQVLSRLLSDVGSDISRWRDLLGNLVGLSKERQRETTDKLLEVVRVLDRDVERFAARDAVREVLHRHRQFAHTDWAIEEPALRPLQDAFDLLAPPNIVDRERWVFAAQPAPPNPSPGHDWQKMEEQNATNRRNVAGELVATGSVDVVFAMAAAVDTPFQLGAALIECDIEVGLRNTLVDRAVRSSETNLTELGRGMIYAGVAKYGLAWATSVVRSGIAAGWPATAIVSVLQGMPTGSKTWALAQEAGADVERQYWETTPWLWIIHGTMPEINIAAQALLRVDRAVDTVALIGQVGPTKFASPLLLRALREASSQLGKARDYNGSTMLAHYCGLILDQLVADPSVSRDDVTSLEWTYFGLMQKSGRNATLLEAALASSPEFFLQVISTIYRGDDEDAAEVDAEVATRRGAVARQSYALLGEWSAVPGADASGNIDGAGLNAWIDDARALAVSAKRVDIVDQHIGMILSAAKAEPNGDWPPKPVRDVIERLKSRELDLGFVVGTGNRRAATTRGPLDGGEQERELKNRYDELAKRFRVSAPRTAAILRSIGTDNKVVAIYMDRLADEIDVI